MMLPLIVTIMVVGYSFQSLFTRLFSANYQGADASQSTSVFSICFGFLIGLATLVVGGFSFSPSWQTALFGAFNAVMLLLYNRSMIEGGNRGSYSFLMIVAMFGGILVPMLMEILVLHNALTLLQGVGIALMLGALVVMNLRGISLKGASGAYYFWCALLFLSNGLFSCGMTLQQTTMQGAQRTEMLTILYFGSSLIMLVMQLARGGGKKLMEGFKMGRKSAVYVVVCGLSATLAANLLLYCVNAMDNSVLYTINNGGVLVLSVLYACFLFKEKLRPEQILGIVMAVGSIALLSL